ncbi:MAG: hypothetical protein K2H79_04875 [Bacteroidaceae bacterium]|nr:hypothetical protein [Bacteroidaceae bacterium]
MKRLSPGRTGGLRLAGMILLHALLTTACEKVDIEAEKDKTKEMPVAPSVLPTASGKGTQDAPFLVEQVINGENTGSYLMWYIGYVVGSTYRTMQNPCFEAETSYTSNILLSSDPQCKRPERCIPVELRTVALQKAFSLHHNSNRFRQCIVLQGHSSMYFLTNGLRDIQTGYWLPDFDLSTIKTAPSEWEERSETY